MTSISAIVGIVSCPATGNIYGIRMEEYIKDNWTATWSFPIDQKMAIREGYIKNEIPINLIFDADYPGCPYCKKREDFEVNIYNNMERNDSC
jgi:hypothetical protein